jgi:hypothetical protein
MEETTIRAASMGAEAAPEYEHVLVHDQILSEVSISPENAGPVGRRQKNA